MAELLMECEEEELEPWQQKSKAIVIDDEDDDEPIFVREISVSQTTNTSKTTGGQHGSFAQTENGLPNRGNNSFPMSNNHYKPPAATQAVTQQVRPMYQPVTRPTSSSATVQPLPRPVGIQEPIRRPAAGCIPAQQPPRANPVMQTVCRPQTFVPNPLPVCRTPTIPSVSQPAPRPVATITAQPVMLNQGYMMNSPQISSSNSNVMYTLQPNTALTQYQSLQTFTPSANIGRNENALIEKRPSTVDLINVSPKKPKTNENIADKRPATASITTSNPMSSPARPQTTLLQNTPAKGTNAATTPTKNGTPFPRACPKCNIHFNLLEPMKKHMTYCCPEKMQILFHGVINPDASKPLSSVEDIERGKLVMLVSEFYYGSYSGDYQLIHQEEKTHTTFKCFSCQKLLKNNIKFMNHMKHHLELEKQSTESWENHTTCHHCYRQFSTPFQLQCHIESSHTLYESTTICKICELSFDSEQILLQHMKDSHKPGEMPYVCQVCNYRSSVFVDVDNHFRSTHENTKCLLCPFCLKVIKSGTPYMQHYMKHQNKGVLRCPKCRLQFLTCKEKMDHKTQHHRTFKKPKQLEGLPPGTKVTIRASVGVSSNQVSSPTPSISRNLPATPPHPPPQLPHYTLPQSPPVMKTMGPVKNRNLTAKKITHPIKIKPPAKKPASVNTSRKTKIINTALQSIRVIPGIHKCIECHRQVVDFEGHFHTYVHCSKCKFSTSCNKAYTSHVLRCHGRNSSKRSKVTKKSPIDKRRITVVCLNCDFMTDVSGLDDMAKHLSENPAHSCQVVTENVSILSSTHQGDMSIPRLYSSVKLKQISGQEEKTGSHVDATAESMEDEHKPEATKKEDNSCESNMTSLDHTSTLSNTDNMFVRQVNLKAATESPGSCSPKSEKVQPKDLYNKDDCDMVQEKICSEATNTELSEPTHSKNVSTEKADLCLVLKEGLADSDLAGDDAEFKQYLTKQAPDSVGSDISEPSSIHLDPLTPSEVLEYEATEILQKGAIVASQKGGTGEQGEDNTDSSANITVTKKEEPEAEAGL
ncbi:zinc finger protein 280D isoform X2 [Ranitomeya variabilis]|uniref:zinc finger protein 280D isoform X2 n=1 Tax=Ranitomeya variabilis TaxID=490064 RepID=UPI0040579A08